MTHWTMLSFHRFGNSDKILVITFLLVLKYGEDFPHAFPLCLVGLDSMKVKVGRGGYIC